MRFVHKQLHTTTALIALAAASMAAPAYAQTVAPTASGAQAADDDAEVIIVTGSRIARPDLESGSPVAIVAAEEINLQAGSANVENVLNDLPQVTSTTNSASNNPGNGTATVNLRNLGSQRTLVLVDGRRYMSFDVNQIVDLNTIPSALIDRVDVVTGGQSAVYGSDAISGVVNFILKRDFSGAELGSSYTITERGDGAIWDINGTLGANTDDGRGNATIFLQYTKRSSIFAGDRAFARNGLSDSQTGAPPTTGGGSSSVPQGRINVPGLAARLGLGCTTFVDFNGSNGEPSCYNGATESYNFSPVNYLQLPQERFLGTALGQYEINSAFTLYSEAQFAYNIVPQQLAATPISNGTPYGDGTIGALNVQTSSPFFSPALRTALAGLDTDGDGYVRVPQWSYRTVQIDERSNRDERNSFRILGGVRGDLGAGFSYDGYYMYSRTNNSQRQLGNVAIDRFLAATETALVGGQLVCRDPAARAAGCAPANIFGEGLLSDEAAEYLGIGATNLENYTTQVLSAVVSNPELFDLGAGGVGFAGGFEWRSEQGAVIPDQYLASGNVAGFNPGQPTAGGYNVKEVFGELRVPILNENIVERFEVTGAARHSNYSNAVGNVFTYAVGAELAPVRDVTFRAQYQRAIRGPSVNELFLGSTVSFNGNAEGCDVPAAAQPGPLRDICVAQGVPVARLGDPALGDPNNVNPLTFVGGNPDLDAEKAKTYTIGAVFQPSFLPRFSATIDYYNITIDGYIAPVPTQTIGSLCFTSFQQQYCDLIDRNPLGEIDSFTGLNLNSGGTKNTGIDFGAAYNFPIGAFLGSQEATLGFNFNGSRAFKADYEPVLGAGTVYECAGAFGNNCGVPTPKWRHNFRATLDLGTASISTQWRYLGGARDDDPSTTYGVEELPSRNYFDLTANFDVTEAVNFTLGVSNLFDKEPPLLASGQSGGSGEQSNTFPSFYEVIGRSFYVSARARF